MVPLLSILRLRRSSVYRAVLLLVVSFGLSALLARSPALAAPSRNLWQFVPALLAAWSMIESFRSLERRWSFYHAGVLMLLYAGLMMLVLSLFLWVFD